MYTSQKALFVQQESLPQYRSKKQGLKAEKEMLVRLFKKSPKRLRYMNSETFWEKQKD